MISKVVKLLIDWLVTITLLRILFKSCTSIIDQATSFKWLTYLLNLRVLCWQPKNRLCNPTSGLSLRCRLC